MNICRLILTGFILLTSGLSVQAMELEKSSETSTTHTLQKYICIKQLFLELGALVSADSIPTKESLIPLLATVRYEKLPDLFEIDKKLFTHFFNLKKLHKFFRYYRVTNSQERLLALTSCLQFPALEQFFGCTDLKTMIDLLTNLYSCSGSAEEKQVVAERLQTIIKKIIQASKERELSGVKKTALITTYFDCTAALSLVTVQAEGKDVSCEQVIELFHCDKLLASSGIPWESYEQYCSLTKLISFIATLVSQDTPHTTLCLEKFTGCVKWDNCAELLAVELLGEEIDTVISRKELRQMMCRLQAQERITGEELYGIIISNELLLYLKTQGFDWNEGAKLLNELRQGAFATASKQSLNKMAQLLEFDLEGIADTSLPEEAHLNKVSTLVNQCTNPDWFMRFKYALPFVGIPLTAWLAGHALCHSCMELFEPQSWYTAGPLAVGAFYATLRLSKFFTTPETMKNIIVNAALTKGVRFLSFFQEEGISKDDIRSRGPQQDPLLTDPFLVLVDLLSYNQLDTLHHNRYELLKLFENPLMFAYTCSSFIETLCRKEPHKKQEDYEKALTAFYALLCNQVSEKELPYYKIYTAFINSLDAPCKRTLGSTTILLIGYYNPLILLAQPGFLNAVNRSKISINGTPLSSLLLSIMSTYKEYIAQINL